jgi:hypothetical protein
MDVSVDVLKLPAAVAVSAPVRIRRLAHSPIRSFAVSPPAHCAVLGDGAAAAVASVITGKRPSVFQGSPPPFRP